MFFRTLIKRFNVLFILFVCLSWLILLMLQTWTWPNALNKPPGPVAGLLWPDTRCSRDTPQIQSAAHTTWWSGPVVTESWCVSALSTPWHCSTLPRYTHTHTPPLCVNNEWVVKVESCLLSVEHTQACRIDSDQDWKRFLSYSVP